MTYNTNELHFSYSSLNTLLNCSHAWINKIEKRTFVETQAMREGKEGHRLIQRHIGGIEEHPNLSFLTDRFDIVERVDFDKRCKFNITVQGFSIIGFTDARNTVDGKLGEIKLSSSPWSIGQFQESAQRKLYAYALPAYASMVCITGPRLPQDWSKSTMRTYELDLTDQDRQEGLDWIVSGLDVFRSGDFTGGLEMGDDGLLRCVGRCGYGHNCKWWRPS